MDLRTGTSSHVTRPELDADPRTGRSRRLRDAVFPGTLTRPAHHNEIAVSERAAHCLAPTTWSQQQVARRTDRHDRHHRVLPVATPDTVAVPGHAVLTVPIEA